MDQSPTQRLFRSRTDRVLGGVCGGLAKYFNIDPTLTRVFFAIIGLSWGLGVLLYIVMWLIVPEEGGVAVIEQIKSDNPPAKPVNVLGRANHRTFLAVVLIAIGSIALLNQYFPHDWIRWPSLWALVLVAVGVYIIVKK